MTRLAGLDDRQAKIVELRYFCGLTIEETANVRGLPILFIDTAGLRRAGDEIDHGLFQRGSRHLAVGAGNPRFGDQRTQMLGPPVEGAIASVAGVRRRGDWASTTNMQLDIAAGTLVTSGDHFNMLGWVNLNGGELRATGGLGAVAPAGAGETAWAEDEAGTGAGGLGG